MKRTINKTLFLRLVAQADEADIRGHVKIAEDLTDKIQELSEKDGIRPDDEGYEYSKEDLSDDIKVRILDCAMRIFDYHNKLPDGRDILENVDSLTEEVLSSFEKLLPGAAVGPYEPKTPGEEAVESEGDEVHWDVSILPEEELEDEEDGKSEKDIIEEE